MTRPVSGGGGWLPRESWMWFLGMGAFGVLLVIMVGEIMSRSRPWGAVAVELAGVAVFTGLLVWIAWTWRIGQRAEATWPLVVMGVVAVAIAVFTPGEGLLVGTVAALGGLYLAPRLAVGVIVAAASVVLVSSWFDAQSSFAISHFLETAAVGFFCYGWARLVETNDELRTARQEVARLAVADERVRFGRDLHDLLGHTLSVIRVKSELAARLARTDPERAAVEIGEVEHISRSALVEVRDAVAGFQPDLAVELERAAAALQAAGVTPVIEGSDVSVNGTVGETLAWIVREAATNVVRHSNATRCRIDVGRAGGVVKLIVEDDGGGDDMSADGRGLRGMRERLAGLGGSLEVVTGSGAGFRVQATVPAVAG